MMDMINRHPLAVAAGCGGIGISRTVAAALRSSGGGVKRSAAPKPIPLTPSRSGEGEPAYFTSAVIAMQNGAAGVSSFFDL